MEDVGHRLMSGQHVVCVECVNDALFTLTVRPYARNTTHPEETEVVGVDSRGAFSHLAGLVVVIEGLPHVVDMVTE
jgi:hypothetical protein